MELTENMYTEYYKNYIDSLKNNKPLPEFPVALPQIKQILNHQTGENEFHLETYIVEYTRYDNNGYIEGISHVSLYKSFDEARMALNLNIITDIRTYGVHSYIPDYDDDLIEQIISGYNTLFNTSYHNLSEISTEHYMFIDVSDNILLEFIKNTGIDIGNIKPIYIKLN